MNEQTARILIAEDEEIARENLKLVLAKEGHDVTAVENGVQAMAAMDAEEFDLVLTDLSMPDVDGMAVLRHCRRTSPDTEVLVITGFATVGSAVEAMREGAYHYLAKPYKFEELRALVVRALEKRFLRLEVRALRHRIEEDGRTHIVGDSPAMSALKKSIGQIAPVDSNVLIQGETGTGKELVAKAIHELSLRREQRFLAVNCAAFNEDLLANELFGHERDAFTGAVRMKKGLLESAHKGTFFLDEIGDMPLSMQAKLLRVLEEKVFLRLGGTEEIPVDVRILAATNRDLKEEVKAGAFRQDLFFRLNVIALHIPPLSERREDIPVLAQYFLQRYARTFKRPAREFSEEAMRTLKAYAFPGNVRELENIVERAVVLCNGQRIETGHLPQDMVDYRRIQSSCAEYDLVPLKENEREYIAWVLEQVEGNRTRAAEVLDIDRATLWRKMKRYGLEE